MLQRSRAFRTFGGVDVDVFTLDPQENRTHRDQILADRDALIDGVTVTNLYDWLRQHPLPGGSLRLDRDVFTPLQPEASEHERDTDGAPVRRLVRRNSGGEVMQIDHLRADGTLVLSDRHDTRERGVVGGRSLILCDETGTPVRSWQRVWHLYTAWLDRFTAKQPTFLIVDSKVVAKFVAGYRREHVTTIHVVHGSHRHDGPELIRPSRREVFARLADFDAVVFPTLGQRDDVQAIVGPEPTLIAVPNALSNADAPERARSGAAMVARLEPLKQVDHAIAAVQRANAQVRPPITLDIFGDGPEKARVHELVQDDPNVRLHGFVNDVQHKLSTASTLLLTSRSEAFALAIGEAMAVGCLPIAYDIAYGPGDFITHGKDGWLVAPNDIDALAAALTEANQLDERTLARMRTRARARAAAFSEQRVFTMWARALRQARGGAATPLAARKVLARLRKPAG